MIDSLIYTIDGMRDTQRANEKERSERESINVCQLSEKNLFTISFLLPYYKVDIHKSSSQSSPINAHFNLILILNGTQLIFRIWLILRAYKP